MIRVLALLLALVSPALAQQTTVTPQTVSPPNVVSGVDASGNIQQRQVGYNDLNFANVFGAKSSSTTQAQVGLGNLVFTLDDPTNFSVGYTVQYICTDSPDRDWGFGVITAYATVPGPATITVASTVTGGSTARCSDWSLQVVAGPSALGVPASGGLGISADRFTVPATLGATVSMTIDTGKVFQFGQNVYVAAIGDYTTWFLGSIVSYNSGTGAVTVFVTETSNTALTYSAWTVALVDLTAPDSNLTGYSGTSITIGAGDQTFTTQSGKFFPIQGAVVIQDLSNSANRMVGTIKAYSGTTLIVTVPANGTFGAGTSSAWSAYLINEPVPHIPFYSVGGLQIQRYQGDLTIPSFDITAGIVRDSTNTVDLVSASTSIQLNKLFGDNSGTHGKGTAVRVQLAGTISSSGTTVTGVSSVFQTDFGGLPALDTLSDLQDQFVNVSGTGASGAFDQRPLISTAAALSRVQTVPSDTSMTTQDALTAGAGTTYYRGGALSLGQAATSYAYGIVIAMADATGATSIITTSFTNNGQPDLPAGYTYYRVLGSVIITGGAGGGSAYSGVTVWQPLVQIPLTATAGLVLLSSAQTGPQWSATAGLSVTKTVRAAGGAADCTLIFTNGLLTGGTC